MRPGSSECTMASVPSWLLVSKYTHHIAAVPRKAASSAISAGACQLSRPASVAPVISRVSPSATMTKS